MAELLRSVPPLPQTERGKPTALEADPAGDRILYCNGNGVLWRTLAPLAENKGGEKEEDFFYWAGHAKRTTCAAMSPNANWVVSGDMTGTIRIWGSKGERLQKNEFKLWDGPVLDVGWSADSTRIVAAGDGKQTQAVAILADTGSKTGDLVAHTKIVNSISFRSQRPFRVITGSEDMLVATYAGPPFKFERTHAQHTNFVNCVRYSPDGEWAASAGSDSKICLYEGKSGEFVKEFEKPAGITGSLWKLAWSSDSARIATAGGDKVLRIWDRDSGAQLSAAKVGSAQLEDMQVGLAWPSPGRITSICLDGRLLLWDVSPAGAATLLSTIEGTQGPLSCVACDFTVGLVLQAGAEGVVAATPVEGPTWTARIGKGVRHLLSHSPAYRGDPEAVVVSFDNSLRRLCLKSREVGAPVDFKEGAVAAGWADTSEASVLIVSSKGSLICATVSAVAWSKPSLGKAPMLFPRQPTQMATAPKLSLMAVGIDKPDGLVAGSECLQYDIHLYGIAGAAASPDGVAEKAVLAGHLGEVSALSFCEEAQLLVSGDAKGKIIVWDLKQEPPAKVTDFLAHSARIASLAWLPGGQRFVSGSLDQGVKIWTVESRKPAEGQSHRGGVGAVCAGLVAGSFVTVGVDGFMRVQKPK